MLTNETLQKVLKAFDENDSAAVVESFSENGKWQMLGHDTMVGRKGIRDFFDQHPDDGMVSATKDHIIISGNTAVVDGVCVCRAGEGKTMEMFYCDLYEFEGEKISSLRSYIVMKKD